MSFYVSSLKHRENRLLISKKRVNLQRVRICKNVLPCTARPFYELTRKQPSHVVVAVVVVVVVFVVENASGVKLQMSF